MATTFQSLLGYSLTQAAELASLGFSDYFIPIQITPAALLNMVRQDSVDLELSRVILCDSEPAGVALIARRGWTSRLAGMCVIPAARGHGVGEACVRHLLLEARDRGDRALTLEVIQQNTAAVRLYEKCGFQHVRELVGYRLKNGVVGPPELELEPVDLRVVAQVLSVFGAADLPWQLSGETLAQAGPPGVAFRAGDSWIALSNPDAPTIMVRAIVTASQSRRRGQATALLRAVVAQFPEKTWRVPAIWPEEIGGLFEKAGWQRESLSQFQMMTSLRLP